MFKNLVVRVENVYNFDEIEIMIVKFNAVKVLIERNDSRSYKNTLTKQEMMISIECISADDKYLNFMIIWSVTTHRDNWTIFLRSDDSTRATRLNIQTRVSI